MSDAPSSTRPSKPWLALKRTVDVAGAAIVLLVLSPFMTLMAIAIRLDSRGPVLFRQERLGQHRRMFVVLKFRTMRPGSSDALHREYIARLAGGDVDEQGLKKLTADPRVTRVGRVLRALSLDELPQLFNVLRGDMSLVGPRPALEYELEHYDPAHFARFEVRPGLTGLWQVSGRAELNFKQMLDLDVEYVRTTGPRTDLLILARTPRALVGKTA
jgi:lipopolysaccharide/colanic/teichoic acid biosynthesis glycosyltransferase